ncbi:MAG: hypothetical protein KDI03_01840 [Anaerolineae bacterium]|nr:hypothetical protein [Anaerolineae bacterium]MCB0198786.1 hypothetical protein [Anaerolineae bacterium]MCB0203596.1 hypothetical protein [Anaerolineae bacterium]
MFGFLFGGFGSVCSLVVFLLFIIGAWKMYVKAGHPGWAAIIPIYNIYIILKIVGRPGWWLILFFIPFVNIIILLIVSIDLAKSFGKSAVWGIILLFFLSVIGYLILGWGSDQYQGPSVAGA